MESLAFCAVRLSQRAATWWHEAPLENQTFFGDPSENNMKTAMSD